MAKESFEDRLERLSDIVDDLENGELPLEEGVARFKEGLALARACSKELEAARNEVKLVSEGLLTDFSGEADAEDGKEDQ
ncbi:MAG: exodeoxyribonuclease VII small subunit [Desulfovibrionaceae bacterium]|jgi:exodeoxyribonuclease VII small subunit